MAHRTPMEVVEAYNYELWNKQNYPLGEEILADKVVRHYPGSSLTLTRDEAIARVQETYESVFSSIEFVIKKLLVDGEFVTLLWDMHAQTKQDEPFLHSSIEVFRVVDGQISEFWNPINPEQSIGLWE